MTTPLAALTFGGRSGGSIDPVSPLAPYVLNARTAAFAATPAGSTATANRLNRHSRMMHRLDLAGVTPLLRGLYLPGDTEGQWLINHVSPGIASLTKVGAPTYANFIAGGFTTTAYYDTGVALNTLSQNSVSMGLLSSTSTAASVFDMGAVDGTNGLIIATLNDTSLTARARVMGPVFDSGVGSAYFNGNGWNAVSRISASAVALSHHGVKLEDVTNASAAPVSANTISIGFAKGAAAASGRSVLAAFVGAGLTEYQMQELCAATNDYVSCVRYGDPMIYRQGFGPGLINVDVCFHGCSMASVIGAYYAARRGLSVCIVGAAGENTIWDLGGMVVNGLDWIDIKAPSGVSGIFRDIISFINITLMARVDTTNTQAGFSLEARNWSLAVRRMLDPFRTIGNLPGQNVPVYMGNGIAVVNKAGGKITSIVTNDGRVVIAKVYHEADYAGLFNLKAGLPVFTGREPAGSGAEAVNGYQGLNNSIKPRDPTNSYNIDPYVTPGTPASGYIRDVVPLPSLAAGAYDPAHQSLNYRLTITTNRARSAAMSKLPPRNYDPARYERVKRLFQAVTAASSTMTMAYLLPLSDLGTGSGQFDSNTGPAGFFTDVPQSGLAYANAGADLVARQAVESDVQDAMRGYFYWLQYSGDPDIPAAIKTSMLTWAYDALSNLDPRDSSQQLYWPNQIYIREPTYMLKSSFVLNGNDLVATEGAAPRSIKTISTINYRSDIHALRCCDSAGAIVLQGGYNDTAAGGADQMAPWPLEASLPDKSALTNYSTSTAPSMTKIAFAAARMEISMCMASEFLAETAYLAITGNIAMQDVDYPTARANVLASADVSKMYLPQIN